MKPALTREQWENAPNGVFVGYISPDLSRIDITTDWGPDSLEEGKLALAALCLRGYFTREHVRMIRSQVANMETEFDNPESDLYDDGGLYYDMQEWADLADLIEDLLPPEE